MKSEVILKQSEVSYEVLKVSPELPSKLIELGATKFYRCFNCGNCTAICPLTEGKVSYPRKLIRYSLLGLEDRILSSAEPWLCYYCGECSDYCPRDADPGSFMMSLRRFIIQQYSIGKIAKAFYDKRIAALSWMLLTVLAATGLLLFRGPNPNWAQVDLFSFIPLEFIHDAGLILGVIVGAIATINLTIMYRSISRSYLGLGVSSKGSHTPLWIKNFFRVIFIEVATQLRFAKCTNKKRYLPHMTLFWGFIGLAIATTIVFGIRFYNVSLPREVPLIIGSISGVVLLYGAIYFIVARLVKGEAYSKFSHHSDWMFLLLLFLSVVTGFLLTLFRYINAPALSYITFTIHLIVVFDLLLTAPFTKFAHSIYRPLALWMTSTKEEVYKMSGSRLVREVV